MPLWLVFNFLIRTTFFIFKYSAIFYLAALSSSDAEARVKFALIFGASYLLPVTWAHRIVTVHSQARAVSAGILLLILAFFALASEFPSMLSGVFFSLGFGLLNANFKALFGSSMQIRNKESASGFTLLILSTNLAAAAAAFIAAEPVRQGIQGMCTLFMFCGSALLVAVVAWFFLARNLPAFIGLLNPNQPVSNSSLFPKAKLVTILIIIALMTAFWIGFELRPMALNQLANERLCATTWGLPISATHLQSVNPISYLLLSPLFSLLLVKFSKRAPHPLYLMSSGVCLMGVAYLLFTHALAVSGMKCLSADIFVTLYFLHTVAELLTEPIGLAFITNNSPIQYRSILIVLWECNSGIAYLLAGLIATSKLESLGWLSVLGGLLFLMLIPNLRRYVQ